MPASASEGGLGTSRRGTRWQTVAAVFSVLFGLLMIVQVQLGGDSEWFWYATAVQRGVRLYRDLHLVLQPLFVMETDGWMHLVGRRCLPYESLSLVHVVVFCAGLWMVLRESAWPDWQRALVLFATFFTVIRFDGYRFDDFHIVADIFYLWSMVVLLWLARAQQRRRVLLLAGALGLLSGLAVTNRSTDGGLLALAVGACLLFMALRERWRAVLVFGAVALVTWVLVVWSTGDSLRDYVAYSILKAGSAKGGSGRVLMGPVTALGDTWARVRVGGKKELLVVGVVVLAGYLVERFWKKDARWVVAAEIAFAFLLGYARRSPGIWSQMIQGSLIGVLSTVVQPATYVICVWVLWRAWRAHSRGETWDVREVLVFVPAATLLSAAFSEVDGTHNSTATLAYMMLLTPVLVGLRAGGRRWVSASFVAVATLAGVCGMLVKIQQPYSWGASVNRPIYAARVWYRHPLYGPMYLDPDLLAFTEPLCPVLKPPAGERVEQQELLSIPFPYTNYFCGIPPWRWYVQTWYDTVTPATVTTLMQQLEAAPPRWILYQRQPETLRVHEQEYNQGRPIAHRALDELMMGKIGAGEWKVVRKTHYLAGDAWYLIQTRP